MGGPGQGANVYIIDKNGTNVAFVNASGQLAVDLGGANITATADISGEIVYARVSGQTIYHISGFNDVQISGQTVALWMASGRNAVYLTNEPQTSVAQVAAAADNQNVQNSLFVTAQLTANDQNVATKWNRVRHTASGSALSQDGTVFRLLADTTQAGDTLRTAASVQCTDFSGGTIIGAVRTIHGLVVKNLSGNAPVYVGGIGTNAPFSGKGYILMGNEEREFRVQSASGVKVFATVSGQLISYYGVDF